MILECPNCETSYEIPVELPPEGRKVRCAGCQHIWTAIPDTPEPDISLPNFEDEEIVFRDGEDLPEEPAKAEAETATDAVDEMEISFDPVDAPESDAEPAAEPEISFDPVDAPEPSDEPATKAEDTSEDLSDSAMEEAFTSAFDETKTGEGEAEEPESPPIIIGKAKKRRGPMLGNVAAGWAALVLVLAGVVSIAYFQRVKVVSLLPGAASAYARIGLPVNVRGLEFEKVKYSWETSAGRPVLEVFGDIVNVTSGPLKVPTVVFGLRTKEKVEVYQWAADVRSELLPPGKRTAFSAQIPTPPKSIRDVQVRFAKVR
jgi:predicted Zn finger-like uncharacterized protein